MIKYAGLLLLSVFISSVSQVILKKAAMRHYDSFIQEYLNLPVITAYSIFMIATVLSILAYRGIPLSMGPVLEATGYIYVTVFGIKIFKEKISICKLYALGLIVIGIIVYSLCG